MHIDGKARLGGLFHALTLFSRPALHSEGSSDFPTLARASQRAFLRLRDGSRPEW